jgi:hypothetical protein
MEPAARAALEEDARQREKRYAQLREELMDLRHGLRLHAPQWQGPGTGNPRGVRVGQCGWSPVGIGDVSYGRRDGTPRCYFGGLVRCDSVWLCPMCSMVIRAKRADELREAVRWWCEVEGHPPESVQLLTLTVQHHHGDDLGALVDGVADAWSAFINGKPWKLFSSRVGLVGWARAVETTYGENGWHHHIHALLVLRNPGAVAAEIPWLSERWRVMVVDELGKAAEPNGHGVDVRACHHASYLAKMGCEVTNPAGAKRGRGQNRTPWEIAADLVQADRVLAGVVQPRGGWPEDPDLADIAREEIEEQRAHDRGLWHTWAEKTRGHRMLTWSRDLRKLAGLGEDAEDAAEEVTPVVEVLGTIDREEWKIVRKQRGAAAAILQAAERGGAEEAARVLGVILARSAEFLAALRARSSAVEGIRDG